MNEKDLIRSNSCVTISLSEILPQHSVFVSISPCDGAGFSSISPLTVSASPVLINASPTPLSSSLFPVSTSTLTVSSCSTSSSPETTRDGFSDEGTLDSYDTGMDIESGDESVCTPMDIDEIPMDIDEIPMDTQQPVMFRKKSSTGQKGGKRPNKSPKGRSLLSR